MSELYNRTQNDNGTYNTRCLYCFMTIASCIETETQLDTIEAHHLCPEKMLAELRTKAEQAPSSTTARM